MSIGTMSSKGQITVPKEVRDALGLTPGTRVTFTRNDDGTVTLSATRRRIAELAGRLEYAGRVISIEEMDEAIASGSQRA